MAEILRPIIEGSEILIHKGRYEVQLELPKDTKLSDADIKRIARVSSWEEDPNTCEGYEGNRSVILRRERSIEKKGIQLDSLQLSGIGARGMQFYGSGFQGVGPIKPPSASNFMDHMQGTAMSTGRIKDDALSIHRPEYRAMGTYTFEELKEKLAKTIEISGMTLDNLIVPHVEAYGRYLDSELSDERGQFGFIVFPSPGAKTDRIGKEFQSRLNSIYKQNGPMRPGALWNTFLYVTGPYIKALGVATRELHERARRVHLQMHLGNAYLINGIPYIMDWATMENLDGSALDNIGNRSIDLAKPCSGFCEAFDGAVGKHFTGMSEGMHARIYEMAMEAYSLNPYRKVDMGRLMRHGPELGNGLEAEFGAVVFWMVGQNFEDLDSLKRP